MNVCGGHGVAEARASAGVSCCALGVTARPAVVVAAFAGVAASLLDVLGSWVSGAPAIARSLRSMSISFWVVAGARGEVGGVPEGLATASSGVRVVQACARCAIAGVAGAL